VRGQGWLGAHFSRRPPLGRTSSTCHLRNSIIHADQHNNQRLQSYPIPAWNEAWIIGLWYLEVLLSKLFGYSGRYANRQTRQAAGQTEMIP
jgi:hypothetical protein